jgi:ABC-2 type transport system permease protein
VVRHSLVGVHVGQIGAIALGLTMARARAGATPAAFVCPADRRRTLLVRATTVAATTLALGLVAATSAFAVGQHILRGNGFDCTNGVSPVWLTDPHAARAIAGSALYLCAVAVLAVGISAVVPRARLAFVLAVGLLYVPLVIGLAVPDAAGDAIRRLGPLTAGLAVQRTAPGADDVPIGPWTGLSVTWCWAGTALALAASRAGQPGARSGARV